MQPAELQNRLLDVTAAVNNDIDRDDQAIGLVTAVGAAAAAAGVMQWDYINMVKIDCSILPPNLGAECPDGDDWWLSYSVALWGGLRSIVSQIWFQDEIQPHTPCVDDSNWKDSQNNTCQDYNDHVLCEDHGIATAAFVNRTGEDKLEDVSVDNWHAAHMCCLCGGGYHDAPVVEAIYQ